MDRDRRTDEGGNGAGHLTYQAYDQDQPHQAQEQTEQQHRPEERIAVGETAEPTKQALPEGMKAVGVVDPVEGGPFAAADLPSDLRVVEGVVRQALDQARGAGSKDGEAFEQRACNHESERRQPEIPLTTVRRVRFGRR